MSARSFQSVIYRLLEGRPIPPGEVEPPPLPSTYEDVVTLSALATLTGISGTLPLLGGAMVTGAEEYATAADMTKLNWASSVGLGTNVLLDTILPRSGLKCYRFTDGGSQSAGDLIRDLINPQADVSYYWRGFIRIATFATNKDMELIHLSNTSPSFKAGVRVDTVTHALVWDSAGQGGAGDVGTTVLDPDTWYMVEGFWYRNNDGSVAKRQYRVSAEDGTLLEESSVYTTDPGNFSRLVVGSTVSGPSGGGYDWRLDDLILIPTPGLVEGRWPGLGHVGTFGITGTVSSQWAPTGGTPNHVNVDESPGASPDDADYNESSTSGQIDRFTGAQVTAATSSKRLHLFVVNGRFHGPASLSNAFVRTRVWDPNGDGFTSDDIKPATGVPEPMRIGGCVALEMEGFTVADLAAIQLGYEQRGADAIRIMTLFANFEWLD